MLRKHIQSRNNWQKIVEEQGLPYHSAGGVYWQDDVYYELSYKESDYINQVTNSVYSKIWHLVHQMMLNKDSRERVKNFLCTEVDEKTADVIMLNWDEVGRHKTRSTYGRFDVIFDENNKLKVFEYNADTPVVLVESSYIQWQWFVDNFGGDYNEHYYQNNNIYPYLLEAFTAIRNSGVQKMIMTCDKGQIGEVFEYEASSLYLMEVAKDAGIDAKFRFVEDLVVNMDTEAVISCDGEIPDAIFKLFPSEWMVADLKKNGHPCPESVLKINRLYNEPYKLLLGGKWLLPELYHQFGTNDGIIPAWHTRNECLNKKVVAKSYYGRIGMEVEILEPYQQTSLQGAVIYQEYVTPQKYEGHIATIGSFHVNGEAAGIGIREHITDITTDSCKFASHIVSKDDEQSIF